MMYSIDFGLVDGTPLVLNQDAHMFSQVGQDILATAHLHGLTGYCTCSPKRPKMIVKHYHTHYGVARFPNTALLHNNDCPYYAIPSDTSGVGSYRGAITETAVHLNIPIKSKALYGKKPKTTIVTNNNQQREIRTILELKGLLHHIWEHTGLNTWSPYFKGKRSIVSRVLDYGYYWGHYDTLISERMMVLFPKMPLKYAEHNTCVIKNTDACILVMGYLHHITGKQGSDRVLVRLKASAGSGKTYNFIDDYLFFGNVSIKEQFDASFEHTVHTAQDHNNIVVFMRVTYRSTTDNNAKHIFNITDICFMAVCGYSYGIPFATAKELVLLKHLLDNDRYFMKPLCYDDTVLSLPNFVLTDTQDKTPLFIGTINHMPPLPIADTYTQKGGM